MEILILYSHDVNLTWLPELVERLLPGSRLTKTMGKTASNTMRRFLSNVSEPCKTLPLN